MAYNFSNYSFSNSLKSMIDPFAQLLKKSATPATPTSLFTPASTKSATPALNYSPYMPAPNASTITGPKYFAPSVFPQSKPTVSASVSSPVAPKPAISPGFMVQPPPQVQQQSMAPTVAPGTSTQASQAAPGAISAPAMPSVSPEALKAMELAQSAYQQSQKISPEELSTQEDIDKLVESTKTAYRNTSGQAIPLEFITGQLASIERRATGLAEPLERKLSRMQAARTSSLESSKFALERADKAVSGERDRFAASASEAESARRFGITTGLTESQQAQQKFEADRKFAEDNRQFGLTYANQQRELAIKETEAISPYQAERGRRNLQSVDELLPRVSNKTVGLGSYANLIRGTEAYNFKSDLDTLKANIAFGELTAMREASKTGGALGQVSDREGQLLQAALGALDPGQSPENFTRNLNKIKDSINRWYVAVGESTSSGGGTLFKSPSGATYQLPY